MIPPRSRIDWRKSVRIVPSRYPPVGIFDRVAHPSDLEAVFAIEALTNDRLRDETGDIHLVPEEDRISGAGTSPIMAAFTHINPEGSRFSDGSYGVYYAGESIDTAIAESRFHRQRFLAYSSEPPIHLEMRTYFARVRGIFHDLRGSGETKSGWFHPDPASYDAGQAFARKLRVRGSHGLVYKSVRRPNGKCVAVFRPRLISPVTQGPHFEFIWDGESIADVLEVKRYDYKRD